MENNKALFYDIEALEKKKAMAIEKINAYMQKLKVMEKKFDPLPRFTFHRVLSQVSPQFYTIDELTQIEKIDQILCEEINLPLISQSKIESEKVHSKKRCHPSNESIISDGGRQVKPKPTKERKPRNHGKTTLSSPPPELPNHVSNMIKVLNGSDIKYIMCKTLYMSDLSHGNKRLSMSITQIKSDFLTEMEKATLETENEEGKPMGLKVIVLDPSFKEFSLSLKKWNMKTTSVYNLIQDWSFVLLANDFKEYQQIHIWSFRVDDKLYFLLDNNESQKTEKSGEVNRSIVISKSKEE